MNKYRINKFMLLFLFISVSLKAQTIEDIINKHIEAIGGTQKIAAIKSINLTGVFSGGMFEFPVTMIFKRENKIRMEITQQNKTQISAFDGTTAWEINTWMGKESPEKMTEGRAKSMREKADFEGLLVNYKAKGYTAELIGKENIDSSETYKIKLTDKENEITYYFIDTQSYLILKQTTKRKIEEDDVELDSFFSNYKQFEGVMFAISTKMKLKGSEMIQKRYITNIEINPAVEDSIFVMPKK